MIKIRTITYNMPECFGEKEFAQIEESFNLWNNFDFEVHTQRVNLPVYKKVEMPVIDRVAAFCEQIGVRWFSVPVEPGYTELSDMTIEDMLARHKSAFCNMICARNGKVSDEHVRQVACQFLRNAKKDESGLIGFRFGASMNIAPNGPFFPFTHSSGKKMSFAIGLELAEEINRLCEQNFEDLNQFRSAIFALLEPQFARIEEKAKEIALKTGLEYDGMDFSLAPLPQEGSSVISILRKIGIEDINDTGMLFATAFLTKILKTFPQKYQSVGFAGVMYSLLEDSEYAEMNARKGFSLNNMIALSTMCGCGVDMVPIPDTTTEEMIRTILLEVACVSSRLHKPLGVRLLPVANKGDGYTHFEEETDFVVNTRIVDVAANKLEKLIGAYEY